MPRFEEGELFQFFKHEFHKLTAVKQGMIWCIVPAKNRKGRDVALICYLQENKDKSTELVPVARMLDPAHRLNYDITDKVLPPEDPQETKKAA